VLRIHLILMRIRILDPQWIKMDLDPGNFFRIYWIFLTKIISIFCFIFFVFLSQNLINNSEMRNFYNLSFFKSSELGFRSKKVFFCSFWVIFYPLDPHPWIRIFFWIRIRIQEAKILRILSTDCDPGRIQDSF